MANRLLHETSPYLLQHAHNPVDWYPWGEEAFEEARRRGVPVLLSVGYAACHWCHVMERESFENPLIAARMNSLFVNVKVDREERPDLDDLYMRAVQAFNRGHGGWPMTVFLTPDGVPFFGGTYFPPVTRGTTPGLVDVLLHVSETFHKQPDDVTQVAEQVMQLLQTVVTHPAKLLARSWLEPIAEAAAEDYDPVEGGFGSAPKFPAHGTLAALIAHYRQRTDLHALSMVRHTLDAMSKGGVYDLLAGGFCRYSVDAEWRIPHFEKMLYDNAQLIPLYVDAWRITRAPHYARIARETVGFVLRDLGLSGGGFASSLDADTEGVEGATYAFSPAELQRILGDDALRVGDLLGVTAEGTFEHGTSVLRLDTPLEELPASDQELLLSAFQKLGEARSARPQPPRDDKRIVAWNALTISALARGSSALGEPGWLQAAIEAWEFLEAHARVDGRWMRTFREGQARIPAFADDHADLLNAALDLWEATFDPRWLRAAEQLVEVLLRLFWDEREGALYLAGNDQPPLVSRSRAGIGGAEPGALGMAALGLIRAARLLDRPAWSERAERMVRSAQAHLARAPRSLGAEALAGAWLSEGGMEIAIVGRAGAPDTEALLAEVHQRVLPFAVIARIDPDLPWPEGAPRLPWAEGKPAVGGRATAYVCEGHSCQLPTSDPATLGAQLEERTTRASTASTTIGLRVRAPELPSDPAAWLGADAPLSLARLRGSVVVLDFWTYCCINCLHVLPELKALEERYAGQPVVVIGVHCAKFPAEEIADNVRRAMQRHEIRHPVIHDPEHALWEEYAVRSWPTLVVIDAEGKIAHQQSGETSRDDLAKVIDSLLGEARKKGILASSAVPAPRPSADPGEKLRYPGKVHVWPDAFEQEMEADAFDGTGRLYVSDTGHHQIVECALALGGDGWPELRGIRRFGSGEPGLVDGPAKIARFRGPQGIRRYEDTLYVADTENHALRAIDLGTGEVRTLAGTGRRGKGTPTREALAKPLTLDLRSPWDVEVMQIRQHHLVFVAMAGSHQIWVYGAGHLGIHAGSGREDHVDGPSAVAALAQPSGLTMLGRYLLFADAETSSIRAVDLQSHQVVTVVGRGLFDFGDVDGKGDLVRLQHPLGLTFAGDHVYVADTFNHKIKAIALQTGDAETLAGGDPSALCEPGGIARAGDHLVVADTNHHRLRAVSIHTGEIRDLPLP